MAGRRLGHLIACTGEEVVRLWEGAGGWRSEVVLSGVGARCVAVDAAAPGRVAVGGPHGVHESHDGGASWLARGPEPPHADVFSVAIAADGSLYAGTEPSRLFRARGDEGAWQELAALQAIPSRPTWSFPPRPWTSHVRWIAPHPRVAERLLVGIELGGLMRSEDAGASFADHADGAQRDVHSLVWHPIAPGCAYEAGGGGAAWSRDGGVTWEPADAGLGRPHHYCWAVAADPTDPERWLVSAASGPGIHRGRGDAGLYLWEGGGPWRRVGPRLDVLPAALVWEGEAVVVGLRDGGLLLSADRGVTWREEPAPVPAISALASVAT